MAFFWYSFFFSLLFQHDACIGLHAVIFSFSWYLQVNNTLYWGHSAKTYLICLMMAGWSFTILIYRLNIIPGTYYIDWQKKSPHCIFSLSYDWGVSSCKHMFLQGNQTGFLVVLLRLVTVYVQVARLCFVNSQIVLQVLYWMGIFFYFLQVRGNMHLTELQRI